MSPELAIPFWTVTVAALCATLCALLGVWLVLQRVSLTGDAISHSVLPGLALTFIWFGTREPAPMLIGAGLAGLGTVALTRLISQSVRVGEDASLGVVFTTLFALGVILITRYAAQVDLDAGCVLYGLVEFVALDTVRFGGFEIPAVLRTILPVFALSATFLWLFRRELALMAFDPGLARTLGKRPGLLSYALMACVAAATVASFEAVGSILVVAMLIGPAATAQLLTRRLGPLFALSAGLAIAASAAGYALAAAWNTSVAGMIATVLGCFYAVAAISQAVRTGLSHG